MVPWLESFAVTKFSFMIDHVVTVLEVNDREVVVGDPLSGLTRLSHEQFCAKWLFVGIVLKRNAKS